MRETYEEINNSVLREVFDYCAVNKALGHTLKNEEITKYWVVVDYVNILCTEQSKGPMKERSGHVIRSCQKAYVLRGYTE